MRQQLNAAFGMMLRSAEYLTIVIEFSIGLAGFSAIVSVFLHGSGGLRKVDKHRVSNLLSFALVPGFVALSCIGFELILKDLDSATRISSAALGVSLIAIISYALHDRRSIPGDQLVLIRAGIGAPFFVGVTVTNITAQICAVMGLIQPVPTAFFGLVVTLLLGVIQFGRIVLLRDSNDA